jgi:PAS domain S-box-containing protein
MEVLQNQSISLLDQIAVLEKENAFLKAHQVDIIRAKELYLKIFEDFPALIWRANTEKACDYFNRTWLEFTGRTMEQEYGYGWAEYVHPDDLKPCVDTYIASFDKREPFDMEYRLKNKEGEYRWIRDYGRPFYDLDNSFAGYIGSCYDFTDSKINELKLKELNDAKNRLFETIGHDLHNPFHSILGLSELLMLNINSYSQEKSTDLSKKIFNSTLSAYKLLENLLEWAKLQSNNIAFSPKKFDVGNSILETKEFVNITAATKNIRLNINISNIIVFADQNMVNTIIRNLISNAIKYTPCGGEINVTANTIDDIVIVMVQDNGVGMSDEIKNKLFNLQLHPSAKGTNDEKGTGLGLIICKEFVKMNKGDLWVKSELNKGSQFFFSLPLGQG